MVQHTASSPPLNLKERGQTPCVWENKSSWLLHSSLCFSWTSFCGTSWPSRCAESRSSPCVAWSFCSDRSPPPSWDWKLHSALRQKYYNKYTKKVQLNIKVWLRIWIHKPINFCCICRYLDVVGAPSRRLLVLLYGVLTGGAVWRLGRQFVQQVSVQLLGFRQSDLQQESLHHQLLQLRTETCDRYDERRRVQRWNKKTKTKSTCGCKELKALTLTLEWNGLVLCVKKWTVYFLSQMWGCSGSNSPLKQQPTNFSVFDDDRRVTI